MQDLTHTLQGQLRSWNVLDWVIATSLAVSTCAGFFKGFISSLISLLAIFVGVFAASYYAPRCGPMLQGWVVSPLTARLVAFFLLLATVYLVVTLVGRLLRSAFRAVGLGFFDRVAGALFGWVRGAVVLAVLVLPMRPYVVHSIEGRSSRLLPYLLQVSHGVFSVVPQRILERLYVGHIRL